MQMLTHEAISGMEEARGEMPLASCETY